MLESLFRAVRPVVPRNKHGPPFDSFPRRGFLRLDRGHGTQARRSIRVVAGIGRQCTKGEPAPLPVMSAFNQLAGACTGWGFKLSTRCLFCRPRRQKKPQELRKKPFQFVSYDTPYSPLKTTQHALHLTASTPLCAFNISPPPRFSLARGNTETACSVRASAAPPCARLTGNGACDTPATTTPALSSTTVVTSHAVGTNCCQRQGDRV